MKVLVADEWRHHDFTGQSVGVLAPPELTARIVPASVTGRVQVWVGPASLPGHSRCSASPVRAAPAPKRWRTT